MDGACVRDLKKVKLQTNELMTNGGVSHEPSIIELFLNRCACLASAICKPM